MTNEDSSQCKDKCDHGFTRNGNKDNICSRCDTSCERCRDDGFEGDNSKCTVCAPGFNLRMGESCL